MKNLGQQIQTKNFNLKKSFDSKIEINFPVLKRYFEEKQDNEKIARQLNWEEYKLKERRVVNGDLNGIATNTLYDPEINGNVSFYKNNTAKAKWDLIKISQSNFVFYVGVADAIEIDKISAVPEIKMAGKKQKSGDLYPAAVAERILDRSKEKDEWQRKVDSERVNNIAQFIKAKNNIIANSPMLYIHSKKLDHKLVDNEDGTAYLDADWEWLKKNGGGYCDHDSDGEFKSLDDFAENSVPSNFQGKKDLRPIWIIDGQHRVRGIAASKKNIKIPIILIPRKQQNNTVDESLSKVAKLFTEINTLQVQLDPLHELFLLHRFYIHHALKPEKDFQHWKIFSKLNGQIEEKYEDARANHLSYDMAARLTKEKESPLKDLIKFLPQIGSKSSLFKVLIDADKWLKYTRHWFKNNGPYSSKSLIDFRKGESLNTQIQIFEEVCNFFNALISTCNHYNYSPPYQYNCPTGWPDKKQRWLTVEHKNESIVDENGITQNIITRVFPRFEDCLIQNKSFFQMILQIYPFVHNVCWKKQSNQILANKKLIPFNVFLEILSPLKNVDWITSDLFMKNEGFMGGGETGRKGLRVWIQDAISQCNSPSSPQDTMSQKIESVPGQGILAKPGQANISLISQDDFEDNRRSSYGPAVKWPTKNTLNKKGDDVCLESERPWNSTRIANWIIEDDQGSIVTKSLKKKVINVSDPEAIGQPGYSRIRIKHNPIFFKKNPTKYLIIKVLWMNAVGTSKGGTIKLP